MSRAASFERLGLRRVGALAVALGLVLQALPCAGFELLRVNGDPCDNASRNLSWAAREAPVDVRSVGPAEFADLAATAWSRWNENVGSFRFRSDFGSPCDLDDGVVTITFGTTNCGGGSLGDALAVTTSRWFSDGRLADAEIVVNTNSVAHTNQAVFLEVVMHELGHVLGLDHSDACGRSGAGTLMKSVLVLGQSRLDRPQTDDIAGANFIYASGGSGETPAGANSCEVTAPRGRRFGLPLLLVPFFLVLRRLLRRRASL